MSQLYLHDMSVFTKLGVSSHGKYEFDQEIIDVYFQEAQHFPYFINCEGEIAGFALVRQYPYDRDLLNLDQFLSSESTPAEALDKELSSSAC